MKRRSANVSLLLNYKGNQRCTIWVKLVLLDESSSSASCKIEILSRCHLEVGTLSYCRTSCHVKLHRLNPNRPLSITCVRALTMEQQYSELPTWPCHLCALNIPNSPTQDTLNTLPWKSSLQMKQGVVLYRC